jgi:hypothetical protein
MPVAADDAFEELAASGAHEAVDAEDLACPDRKRNVIDGETAGPSGQADLLGTECLRTEFMVSGLGEILGIRADHRADDPFRVDVAHHGLAGDLAVTQYGDVIADPHQLFQPVRDIDDGDTLRLQFRDDLEEDFDFGRRQRRGRLVHDQDTGIERHRLGDLDQLLLADRQVLDHRLGADAGIQPIEEGVRLFDLRLVIDAENAALDFAGGEDVFRHRHVGEEVELLEDHPDAVRLRVRRAVEGDGLAVENDAAERRALDAGDDLHQRRFAGAVLADQHVDRAAAQLEIRTLDGDDAGIDLRHLFEAQDDVVFDLLGHRYGPTVISAGVTSGKLPGGRQREGAGDR